MSPFRVVFYGTPEFAVPVLERLALDARFQMVGVVTQPDRPVGRHATLTPPPVKNTATKLHLRVIQYEKIKSDEAFAELQALKADVAVVASFGQIIPDRILNLYPHGMINVHPSLLPHYRGATPIPAAIKNGDAQTGVSIMKMDALMDHGPLLIQVEAPIQPNDTTESLGTRLFQRAADLLPNTLFQYIQGELKPQEQNHTLATQVKLLSREDGLIDWHKNATDIEQTVRAYDPWPGTFTMLDGKRLKILATTLGSKTEHTPGQAMIIDKQPAVACGDGTSLILKRVQPEGKTEMTGTDFLRGKSDWLDNIL